MSIRTTEPSVRFSWLSVGVNLQPWPPSSGWISCCAVLWNINRQKSSGSPCNPERVIACLCGCGVSGRAGTKTPVSCLRPTGFHLAGWCFSHGRSSKIIWRTDAWKNGWMGGNGSRTNEWKNKTIPYESMLIVRKDQRTYQLNTLEIK